MEADSNVTGGAEDPDAFSPFDLNGNSGDDPGDDDIGTFTADCGRLAESAITNGLPHTYLCVGVRTRQRPVGHSSACGLRSLWTDCPAHSLGPYEVKLVPFTV